MIDAKEITKKYIDGSRMVLAVNQVNFHVNQGEFVLVVGRSGSGKSTLLSILGGLIRPDAGAVTIDGSNLWNLDDTTLSAIRAEKIGFIFQFSGLLPTLTAIENVMLPSLFVSSRGGEVEQARRLLAMFGLADKQDSYISQMSGGEQKRVAIARALMNDPEIILADEPTGDLDIDTEREIMELFRGINQKGKTIVMVTHNPDLSSYADSIYRMDRGSVKITER
jgi:ABC-type lipoprotein export system ATPase subunit